MTRPGGQVITDDKSGYNAVPLDAVMQTISKNFTELQDHFNKVVTKQIAPDHHQQQHQDKPGEISSVDAAAGMVTKPLFVPFTFVTVKDILEPDLSL